MYQKWSRGGFDAMLGRHAPTTWIGRSAMYFIWSFAVGVVFMALGSTQANFTARDILLGASWVGVLGVAINHSVAPRRSESGSSTSRDSSLTSRSSGATAFVGGAVALAWAQWADGGLRFVLWAVGLVLVTVGLRVAAEKGRSRAFNRAAALGVGIWLVSVVLHAALR